MDRLFLAIPAILYDHEHIKKEFSTSISGRWMPVKDLHVTLYYFGDAFERVALVDKLTPLVSQIEASELKGLGYFARNNILYAKTKNSSLEALFARITNAMGLPTKGTFVPHVTLMRIKQIDDREGFEKRVRLYDDKSIGSLTRQVQLMRSHLHSHGARYELIKRFEV